MECKNCQQELIDNSDYCNKCGGRVIRNRLTFRNLFEHITETFFNVDNKLLRTFLNLFKRPEDVIAGYINGVRKKYVNPISYLALAISIGGLYVIILNKYFPDALSKMGNPMGVKAQEEAIKSAMSSVQEYYSIIMVLFIPIYALISRLVFVNRKEFNLTEHIVMAMYIVAQFSLLSSFLNILILIFNIPPQILGAVSALFQIGFFAYCYKRIYKISFWGIVLRTLFFIAILGATTILFSILSVIIGIIFRDHPIMKSFIESQKAVYEAQKTIRDSIN
ncbi:uncharacterized protein DUF3667 [Winogradskyella wandonensis]|uniref:Uncharacterized protein DUF3667 n=1 Tax=Winogradskyella wandonensis TaxID=1442586 RepID=A0A4R1KVD4_9FLAO|nr:DUF3667 domain-containing protein [Winogradskyella wandonensis]TCK68663.1 uncharacterized protein DUF3667 [Winogradskyella wandonensis]